MHSSSILLLVAAGLQRVCAMQLNVSSPDSIRDAAGTISYGLMSSYTNNATGTVSYDIGTLLAPLYWWEAGAVWGGMIDYWAYTNDTSNNAAVTQALYAQVGADNNYMPVHYYSSLGNDDQAFWAIAVLTAMEYGYPEPNSTVVTWVQLAENVFNTMVPRWGLGGCGGGLKWQIFSYNAGYDYKNSISNGGFFQIAARLARYTGNSTYVEWAEKIFDWSQEIGLINDSYDVYDGTSDTENCTSIDHDQWTYEPGMYIYGTAIMYNYTNSSTIWRTRTAGLLAAANKTFFSPYDNATNIMYQPQCEPANDCDNDQYSFKAYLARWLAKTSIMAPFTADSIQPLLIASAEAAATSCSGGTDGTTCGEKWYVGGYDGVPGIGQQLSALEVVQALLVGNAPTLLTSGDVTIEPAKVVTSSTTTAAAASATSTAKTSKNAVPRSVQSASLTSVLAGLAALTMTMVA